jgi:ribosomal protein S1
MSEPEKQEVVPAEGQPAAAPAGAVSPAEEILHKPAPRTRRSRPKSDKPVVSLDEIQMPRSTLRLKELDEEIAGELEAALSGLSDRDLMGAAEEKRGPVRPSQTGEMPTKGKVLSVHGQDVFIEVPGERNQGVLAVGQFPEGPPAPGTEVDIEIEGYDQENGLLLVRRKGAAVTADWSSVAVGQTVEARVLATNKGGLSVDVNGIRGFMPISQIDLYRVENPEQYVNQRLLCLVAEVNPDERNLVVSRRGYLEKEREAMREKLWAELAEGQVRDGVVRSIKDFGAFVDLGGVDGLVHVSEMSWTRVQDPASVVRPGQSVKVVVLKLDRERRKVSLGMKQLTSSPWDNIEQKYPVGLTVSGKVSRLADFGAFVELEPGVEGLVHVSELAPQRVRRVADVVQQGQAVQIVVLNVDPVNRRISLSLKAALPEPTEEETAEEPAEPEKPSRPRTTPLRGGIGSQWSLPES